VMRVKKVYYKEGAIWPFTVVGRPPQEDTSFGALIHELTGKAVQDEIPGLIDVHAVDAAGVHPVLLAIGSERYTPYLSGDRRPAEILTIANRVLGTGQLSLAKWLFISAREDNPALDTHHVEAFFRHVLERLDLTRDLHFYTKTSIDTLDYSGDGLNTGSKLVVAAAGAVRRELAASVPENLKLSGSFSNAQMSMRGVLVITADPFTTQLSAESEMNELSKLIPNDLVNSIPLITICDNSDFVSETIANWLWVTFTRSNPSHDVYGVNSFTEHKHWGCKGPLIIDARIKPHHAPPLEMDAQLMQKATEKLRKFSGT